MAVPARKCSSLEELTGKFVSVVQISGSTSPTPLFSPNRLTETLSGGYFSLLGTMSKDPSGLALLVRWRVISMCYHIIELQDRNDLIKLLLVNIDFALYVSPPNLVSFDRSLLTFARGRAIFELCSPRP